MLASSNSRKGKVLKFLHNTFMNSFATIYFHNYLRMDEMPEDGRLESGDGNVDSQSPGLHISTFIRQTAFDILYFIEFAILLGFGFSAQIVKDGYLHNYIYNFIWIVLSMTIFALILKFFYYNVLHIWSNTIFTSTRIKSQPFEFLGSSKSYVTQRDNDSCESQSRFVEYVFISSNSWFLGKLKTVKTTLMILPRSLIQMIKEQGTKLEVGITDPLDAAAEGLGEGALEKLKHTARNMFHWRKTFAILCFLPLILLGIVVPLIIILFLITALLLSLPLMVLLVLYNVFGNCRNVIDKTMVDNEEYADKDIEDLPPEIDNFENSIFSCDPSVTLKRVQVDLATAGVLDLNGKSEMVEEELENLTVLLLSLNPRKFRMKELNLDDTRLTDEKMKILAPLLVRFRTIKIGGKQDYGQAGLEELRLYMEHVNGLPSNTFEDSVQPVVKSEKVLLKRLEIKQTKSKIGVTDFTWVNEEVKGIETEDEKSLMVNELAHMIPYLSSIVLDGFLRESAAKPVNSIIGRSKENQLWQLWQKLNICDHLQLLSLRDCDLSDRIILKCISGLCNIRTVDLSGNSGISHVGWKGLAQALR